MYQDEIFCNNLKQTLNTKVLQQLSGKSVP